jgi:hypothetical protein
MANAKQLFGDVSPNESKRLLENDEAEFVLPLEKSRNPGIALRAFGTKVDGVYVVVGSYAYEETGEVVQAQAAASFANLMAIMDQFGDLSEWEIVVTSSPPAP